MERPSGELLPAFAHAFANATVLPAICVAALFGYLSVSFIMLLIRHYGASNTEIVKSTRKMISIGASMLLYPAPWNWKYGAGLACTGAALYGLYLLKRRKLAASGGSIEATK
jgi:adenosine 3'-phospho 5'-phosphosulfate transporter B3